MRLKEADDIKLCYGMTTRENAEAFKPYLEYWLTSSLDGYTVSAVNIGDAEPTMTAVIKNGEDKDAVSIEVEYCPVTGVRDSAGATMKNAFSNFSELVTQTEAQEESEPIEDYSFSTFYINGVKAGILPSENYKPTAEELEANLKRMPVTPNYALMQADGLNFFKDTLSEYLMGNGESDISEEEVDKKLRYIKGVYQGTFDNGEPFFRMNQFIQTADGHWELFKNMSESVRKGKRMTEALTDSDKETIEASLNDLTDKTGGIGINDWFRKKEDIPADQRIDLKDIPETAEQEDTPENSNDGVEVNKLTQEEMTLTFNKLNTYLKKNIAYFKQFFGAVGDDYAMNMFATKMVPQNYKESAIRAYKRLLEGEESADAMEILVEIQLLKKSAPEGAVDTSMVESFSSKLMELLREADDAPVSDDVLLGTDFSYATFIKNLNSSNNDTEKIPASPLYASMDADQLKAFNTDAKGELEASIKDGLFTVILKDGTEITQDSEGKWSSVQPESVINDSAKDQLLGFPVNDILSQIQQSVVTGLNSNGGLSFKLDDKVITVNFMAGKNLGAKNQYSGYFTLVAVKTNMRTSAMSALGNMAKATLGALGSVARGTYSAVSTLNKKGQH